MPLYPNGNLTVTVQEFIKRPELIQRRFTDIAKKMFIVDTLLQTGYQTDAGAVAYTRSESIFMNRPSEEIAPAAQYPVADQLEPQYFEEPIRKYGLRGWITEEAVRRSNLPEVDRMLTRMRNTLIRDIDGIFLARVLADPDIQTRAAAGTWTSAVTTIDDDLVLSKADIYGQLEGYDPDTIVLNPAKVATLLTNSDIRTAFQGNVADQAPIFTGQIGSLFGLTILQTPYIASNTALIMQRKAIGGIVDEVPLQVRPLGFNEKNDTYEFKARRLTATFLTEPKALVKLTGI